MCTINLYRWFCSLSKKHSASFSQESQESLWNRSTEKNGLAQIIYWNRDQTHGKKACDRRYPSNDVWTVEEGEKADESIERRKEAEHFIYRALERDLP